MKTIKYLLMGVLLAGFSTTVNAQEEELNAALSAIKSKSGNVADAAKTAYKKNKKNAAANNGKGALNGVRKRRKKSRKSKKNTGNKMLNLK